MRAPFRAGLGLGAVLVLAVWPTLRWAAGAEGRARAAPPRIFELYVRSPILAKGGERVRVPVRVVCVTSRGTPCRSEVTLATRSGPSGAWQATRAPAGPSLEFDLTGPVARALGTRSSTSLALRVRAEGPGGRTVAMPSGRRVPLRFFVIKEMAIVRAPSILFGRTRGGRTVLFLPWGSGAVRAGLADPPEGPPAGPSSFDVDRAGRIYVVDPLQGRVVVFRHGKPIRETRLPLGARADIAVTDHGTAFVLDQSGDRLVVRRITAHGSPGAPVPIGPGLPGQVRTDGHRGLVDVMPQDEWLPISDERGRARAAGPPTTGRPMRGGGELIRVVGDRSLRLGEVSGGQVMDAIDVRFSERIGEAALTEPDGRGGYWAVAHLWRWKPFPADQYQVLHVAPGRVLASFAVGDRRFVNTQPLARFRLGGDGALYQLVTSPDGARILRFDLGRES